MTTICEREELVLDLLRSGRDLADSDLAPHVATCAACADLVAVASAILDEHHTITHDASVPTSGVIWWRMQRRMREEAVRKATRTMTVVQAISIAATVAIAIAIVGFKTLAGSIDKIHLPELATLAPWTLPLAIALTACLALAPVAIWLGLARD